MEIWTEKYRPKTLDEVVGQEKVVEKLKAFVKAKNLPHLLFAGPAGTGKTTCALAIARELYGEEWRDNLLELNASDERGIDTIRTKVKEFARTRPIGDFPFKIILLDEADALTRDAQQALRRTMENFSSTCRFILDCNFSSKIIEPIQSRCAIFRFKPLEKEAIQKYIMRIAKEEKLKLDKKALDAIYFVCQGDARRAVNILQSCASLGKVITEKMIYEMAGVAQPRELEDVLKKALGGKIREAMDLLMDIMMKYGLSGLDALKQMQAIIVDSDIEDEVKVRIMDKIGEYEFRMVQGSDEFLQLEALLAQLQLVGRK
ncbi:replication factor C small subunit [Nanoarchaeota archaeon]|nr:MAG: replication factor C small subunit [Nanoarchaeota archaeon]